MSAAAMALIILALVPDGMITAAQNSPLATRLVRSSLLVGGLMICGAGVAQLYVWFGQSLES
jgi:hypothetical protein